MEESLIIEIWDTFKEYIPEKNKETAANQFVDFLVGKDIDVETFESLQGFDSYLDEAIKLILDEYKGLDSEDEEGYEDEEDY